MLKPLSTFPTEIKTQRLVLRLLEPTRENAEIIFNIVEKNREYLEEWQGHFGMLHSVDDVLKKLESRHAKTAANTGVMFGIYSGNNLIGRIRFFNANDTTCEIGYWLLESENGKGFMTEAISALESELFKFGFEKIILEIDAGNTKSENVAQRNGYKLEKRIPDDSYAKRVGKCDTLVYAKSHIL